MGKLKGITVKLISNIPIEKDAFNKELFVEKSIDVENVLVTPLKSDEIISTQNLTGKLAVYTLAIPKGDTNIWHDMQVEFFNERWKVIGYPLEGIESMMPLDWNKKVMVERYGK